MKRYLDQLANVGWVLSINLARQLLAVAFLMVLVRTLEKEAVGQFQFVAAAVGLAGIFTLVGLGQAVIQSVARGHPGTYRRTLKWRLAGSLLGSATLAGYSFSLPNGDPIQSGLLAAASLFPVAYGLSGWTDMQAGEGKFRLNAIWQGMTYLLSYGGMILALWLGNPGILWLVVIMNAAQAVVNLAAVMTILRRVPRDAQSEPGALRYGLKMSLWSVANTVGNQIDKLLIFSFLSPTSLAVFVIAERIPEILKNYTESALVILIPKFARKDLYTRDLDRLILRLNVIYFVLIGIVIAILPTILPLAFSHGYADAVLISQLLCATLLLGPTAQFRFAFIRSKLDATAARNIILIANVLRIVLSCAAVPLFGILGAVSSVAISRIVIAILVSREINAFRLIPEISNSIVHSGKNNENI